MAWVRNVLEKNEIKYQVAEFGKVDVGGGGTIAYILANKGTDVIDLVFQFFQCMLLMR